MVLLLAVDDRGARVGLGTRRRAAARTSRSPRTVRSVAARRSGVRVTARGVSVDPPSEYPRGAPRRGRDPPSTAAARQRSRGVSVDGRRRDSPTAQVHKAEIRVLDEAPDRSVLKRPITDANYLDHPHLSITPKLWLMWFVAIGA